MISQDPLCFTEISVCVCHCVCVWVTAVENKCLFAVCVDECVYVFRVESEGLRLRSVTAERPNS